MNEKKNYGFTTTILHSDRQKTIEHGSLHKPIHTSVAFGYKDARQLAEVFQGKQSGYRYGRQGNPTVSAQINPLLDKIRADLPPDYQIKIAGAEEESANAGASIAAQMPLCIFIIFTLLMLQLHSFSRSVMVFLTGPLGLIGAAATLLLLRAPMGFVAQLGITALIGMIIRNSVILVDQIEQDVAAGVPTWNAIVEAAVRRFRPIILTAAAAVLAMIPLSRST